jgi:hypothetical protein
MEIAISEAALYLFHAVHNSNVTFHAGLKESGDAGNIDEFTKTLIKTGHLEIVDITKKEVKEKDDVALEIPYPDTFDDDFIEAQLEILEEGDEINRSKYEREISTSAGITEDTSMTDLTNKSDEENEIFDKTKTDHLISTSQQVPLQAPLIILHRQLASCIRLPLA